MKTCFLLFSLYLLSAARAALIEVPFGGVSLQLQSSISDEDPETLLLEVLTQTVKYLDSSFGFILDSDDADFSHIGLNVDSYDFGAVGDSNSVSFRFSGKAFFNANPTPSQDEILKILAQSFLGRNSQVFTSTLMQSTTPFLQRLSYAIVQVKGFIIPGSVVPEATPIEVQENSATSIGIEEIALIAGSTTAAVLLLLLCYCFFCVRGESDEQNEGKEAISASETHDTDDIEAASPVPSSPQSITSQDSSVFTYNPAPSRISFDASTMSTNTATDPNALALASWQQKNVINSSRFAPFGHDISAIEMLSDKKDLSLIEEGEEEATPVKSSMQYLSKNFLSIQERRERSEDSKDQSEDSDVIADLNNLSQQINHHRRQ